MNQERVNPIDSSLPGLSHVSGQEPLRQTVHRFSSPESRRVFFTSNHQALIYQAISHHIAYEANGPVGSDSPSEKRLCELNFGNRCDYFSRPQAGKAALRNSLDPKVAIAGPTDQGTTQIALYGDYHSGNTTQPEVKIVAEGIPVVKAKKAAAQPAIGSADDHLEVASNVEEKDAVAGCQFYQATNFVLPNGKIGQLVTMAEGCGNDEKSRNAAIAAQEAFTDYVLSKLKRRGRRLMSGYQVSLLLLEGMAVANRKICSDAHDYHDIESTCGSTTFGAMLVLPDTEGNRHVFVPSVGGVKVSISEIANENEVVKTLGPKSGIAKGRLNAHHGAPDLRDAVVDYYQLPKNMEILGRIHP